MAFGDDIIVRLLLDFSKSDQTINRIKRRFGELASSSSILQRATDSVNSALLRQSGLYKTLISEKTTFSKQLSQESRALGQSARATSEMAKNLSIVQRVARGASNQLRRLTSNVFSLGNASNTAEKNVDNLNDEMKEGSGAANRYNRDLNRLNRNLNQLGREAGGLGRRVSGLSIRFGRAAKIARGILIADGIRATSNAIRGLTGDVFNLGGSFEAARNAFITLTGSTETADRILREVTELDIRSPFAQEDFLKATNILLGFGSAAEDVVGQVELIANAATISGQEIDGIALALGQIQGTGRLRQQEANQLINRSVPIYQLLAESLGLTIRQIRELQKEGQITFDQVIKSFQDASEEGGLFQGALERNILSFNGLRTSVEGNLQVLGRNIGRILQPVSKSILLTFRDVTGGIGQALDPIAEIAQRNFAQVLDVFREITSVLPNPFQRIIDSINEIGAPELFQKIAQRILGFIKLVVTAFIPVRSAFDRFLDSLRNVRDSILGPDDASPVVSFFRLVSTSITLLIDRLSFLLNVGSSIINLFRFLQNEFKLVSRDANEATENISNFNALLILASGAFAAIEQAIRNAVTRIELLVLNLKLAAFQLQSLIDTTPSTALEIAKLDTRIRRLNATLIAEGSIIEAFTERVKDLAEEANKIEGEVDFTVNEEKFLEDLRKTLDRGSEVVSDSNIGGDIIDQLELLEKEAAKLRLQISNKLVLGDLEGVDVINAKLQELLSKIFEIKLELGLLTDPEKAKQSALDLAQQQEILVAQTSIRGREELAARLLEIDQKYAVLRLRNEQEFFQGTQAERTRLVNEIIEAEKIKSDTLIRNNGEQAARAIEADQELRLRLIDGLAKDLETRNAAILKADAQLALDRAKLNLTTQTRLNGPDSREAIQAAREVSEAQLALTQASNKLELLEAEKSSESIFQAELNGFAKSIRSTKLFNREKERLAIENRIRLLEIEKGTVGVSSERVDAIDNEIISLNRSLSDLANELPSVSDALKEVFNLSDPELDNLGRLYDNFKGFYDSLEDLRQEDIQNEITAQQARVDRALVIAGQGNAALLEIEEERLQELLDKQEEATARKQRIASLETIASNAVLLSGAKTAVGTALAAPFPANLIAIPTIIGLIATAMQAVQATGSLIDSFWEGSDYNVKDSLGRPSRTGRDGYTINVDGSERVLAKKYNDPIKGVHSRDIPLLVKEGMKFREMKSAKLHSSKTEYTPMVNTKLLERQNEQLIKVNKKLLAEVKKDKTSVILNEKGMFKINKRLSEKEARKRKRFA